MKIRYESFGGIIHTKTPHLTVFVNKGFMKRLGCQHSPIWESDNLGFLSAPLNVHFSLTSRCNKRCDYCYAESCRPPAGELSFGQVSEIIDVLARMGVLSIAFGGGEPFLRDDLFEIARYTRSKGIVPAVTTNGSLISKNNIDECKIFDHIHISLDPNDKDWLKAVLLLKMAGVEVGINYIVDRQSFEQIEDICRPASKNDVRDIMFLRLKPFGRAKSSYDETRLTQEQIVRFCPTITHLAKKYGVFPLVDCSFLPFICWHRPNKSQLDFFGAQGCQGGNYITEINPEGLVRSCSFCKGFAGPAKNLERLWCDSLHFGSFRDWTKSAPLPCNRCTYLGVCRGGCHGIAEVLTGDACNPDPECPFVCAHNFGKPLVD